MRMPISGETRAALELLKEVQAKVVATEDLKANSQVNADLNTLIAVLESPVFTSILNIQDSLRELKKQVRIKTKNKIEISFAACSYPPPSLRFNCIPRSCPRILTSRLPVNWCSICPRARLKEVPRASQEGDITRTAAASTATPQRVRTKRRPIPL